MAARGSVIRSLFGGVLAGEPRVEASEVCRSYGRRSGRQSAGLRQLGRWLKESLSSKGNAAACRHDARPTVDQLLRRLA
jgi:hypothetical protein